jgi:hypothetical protein
VFRAAPPPFKENKEVRFINRIMVTACWVYAEVVSDDERRHVAWRKDEMAEMELPGVTEEARALLDQPGLSADGDVRGWAAELSSREVDIWNQIMSQLRYHYGSIWSSVRTFFTINGLLATVTGILGRQAEYVQDGIVVGVLAIIGLIVNVVAVRVLAMQWSAYLGVLLRKTVLEDELGFYRMRVRGVDLSLPWSVGGEHGSLDVLLRDPRAWYARQRRFGALFLLLCSMYAIVIAIYVAALVMVAIGFLSGYFFARS